ncbi:MULTISPECIES: DUF4276 family protein [unclassified Desulfovibrio]|uniref:DUF4276 family protein n=1 Tax=unclassified Desulfovibrio TaxID=2593640 RepID=UPI001C88F26A|nr:MULTISPECIES: DUF4276 family protein [unclassified Desulfovibrio]
MISETAPGCPGISPVFAERPDTIPRFFRQKFATIRFAGFVNVLCGSFIKISRLSALHRQQYDSARRCLIQGKIPPCVRQGTDGFSACFLASAAFRRLFAGERAFLLVDSEDSVDAENTQKPWLHLAARTEDRWSQPEGATHEQCHLMVVCMESWFLADRQALEKFFGQRFKASALPAPDRAIEGISKQQVHDALAKATSHCKTKAPYGKGEHSFKLLAMLNPGNVTSASAWAQRLVEGLQKAVM